MSRIIRNRAVRSDSIAEVLQDRYRSVSIDHLVTHPTDAIRMAADAAVRSGELSKGAARQLYRDVLAVELKNASALPIVSEFLRTGMADRKRGGAKKGKVKRDR